MTDKQDKLSEALKAAFKKAKAQGCSIDGCTDPVTGIGEKQPYCQKHFWEEFDERYPEDMAS